MTISHMGIHVKDGKLDEMIEWYCNVLSPLGYRRHVDLRPNVSVAGIGAKYPDFWLTENAEYNKTRPPTDKQHIAFWATDRQQVRDFHALAMKAGAKDNGAPGLRPQSASTYYGAYVIDPEGRNIEAHCMYPAFMAEPTQKNIILAGVGVAFAIGISYFGNLAGYLQGLL